MVPWANTSLSLKRRLDRFSHFCVVHSHTQHTDRQTDRRAQISVAMGLFYALSTMHYVCPVQLRSVYVANLVITSSDLISADLVRKCIAIGRSHGELCRFTDYQCAVTATSQIAYSSDEMRSDRCAEMR